MNDQSQNDNRGERIARAIARAGLASRREAEQWILAGRVAVNGEIIHSPALDVGGRDRITVDGKPLPARERTRLFLYHKPRGLITSHSDPQGRQTIFAELPRDLPRLISVGRLDYNTEGLLLLTNDGALARVLELPSTGWLRRYRVRAHGEVSQDKLDALRDGITVSGIHYGPIEATMERLQGSNVWLSFAIREGKNREVRNVLSHLGLTVTRLIRVSFGPFQLGELAEGAVEEVRTRVLREQLGDKLVAQAGLDFAAPLAAPRAAPDDSRAPSRDAPEQPQPRGKAKGKGKGPAPHHSWRAAEVERPGKKLRRKFHGRSLGRDLGRGSERGARHGEDERPVPQGEARRGRVTDRKGRSVRVERYGNPPPAPEPVRKEERPRRYGKDVRNDGRKEGHKEGRNRFGRGGRPPGGGPQRPRRASDRGKGPRPRPPRGDL
jgi:23S rRNA pseudouridine2605 synthase